MQRILVPIDFSKNSLKAASYAAEIAQRSGAAIFLLHVIEPVINIATDSYVQTTIFRNEIVNKKLNQLGLAQKSINDIYPGIHVETELASGSIIASILDFAELKQVDLIVMGTTGASGLKEIFMGSVAAGTISRTKIPVLTIPFEYELQKPKTILLAINQFEKNKELLQRVTDVSSLFSATTYVVVYKDKGYDENAEFIYNEEQLNNYLSFLKVTFPGEVFKGKLLEGEDFEKEIDRFSNENGVCIIAMFTYPKNFLERILRKSVTRKMAFHSTIPILAIPV